MGSAIPKASIVIPLLNQVDAWLDRSVRSALNQTVACDVVVVISPKTKESNRRVLEALVFEYPHLRVVEREPHMRFAAALNLGIRLTLTDRVAFLLTDDWLCENAIEKCLEREADIVSTAITFYAADGTTVLTELRQTRTQAEFQRLEKLSDRASFLGYLFVFRKARLLEIGGVDETLGDSPGVDDFDMIWCLLERGATVALVEESLYNCRDHAGERLTTRRSEDMLATFHRILDKHKVSDREREQMVQDHSRWWGKPLHVVYQEFAPSEVQVPGWLHPLQRVYRTLLPMRTRLAIHDRWIAPFFRKSPRR